MAEAEQAHAVCIPFPAQGHINPMLKLAKLLHCRKFHITFVNTEFNQKRLLRSRGPNSVDGLSSFRFETIADGLPPSDANATQDVPSLCDSTSKNCFAPFRQLIFKLNHSSNVPPVTCIVSDGVTSFGLKVAQELGIPYVYFWTASACGFMAYLQYRNLIHKDFVRLKDVNFLTNNENLDTIIDWIPGLKGIRLKDIPSLKRTTDPNDVVIDFIMTEVEKAHEASAIILNTFDNLEHEVLEALSSIFPPIYTIGPLQLLLKNQIQEKDLNSIGSNLWKEEPGCLEWLDSKEPNSVIYVNFGSVIVMAPQQLIEFAWGLSNSMQTFLWVIRPDLVVGDSAILPLDFVAETKEKGLGFLASWCPQEQILSHPSVGGFITHGGWNSIIESVCGGVPMICWPFSSEQPTNCRYCCTHWGIGMEMDNDVEREKVERLVRELMEGEKGKEMKKKVMEWKKMAEEATSGPPAGSSYLNLDKMVTQILLPKRVLD